METKEPAKDLKFPRAMSDTCIREKQEDKKYGTMLRKV